MTYISFLTIHSDKTLSKKKVSYQSSNIFLKLLFINDNVFLLKVLEFYSAFQLKDIASAIYTNTCFRSLENTLT